MAIVRYGEGDGLERRVGMKHSAKKAAKHPAKKHAFKHPGKHAAKHAEKHAAKHAAKAAKHASKHVGQAELLHEDEHEKDLAQAFHHLQRAVAVVSLLEQESGGDLKLLLENGITLYRKAAAKSGKDCVPCAQAMLRAAEHLGMAGLYSARSEYRVEVAPPPQTRVAKHLAELGPRLEHLPRSERENARRLEAMARELLRRAANVEHDPHLEYELTMAADGICTALEEGL